MKICSNYICTIFYDLLFQIIDHLYIYNHASILSISKVEINSYFVYTRHLFVQVLIKLQLILSISIRLRWDV